MRGNVVRVQQQVKLDFQNLRSQKGAINLSPYSFVEVWQTSSSVKEIYAIIEEQWEEEVNTNSNTTLKRYRPTFYKDRGTAYSSLRSRATLYRNKGVNLQTHFDEERTVATQKLDWKHLENFAQQVKLGN